MVITCDDPVVIDQIYIKNRNFFIHHLHSTFPLILIDLSRRDRGIQSASDDVASEKGRGQGCCTQL